jgi:hypothetical protein
MRYSRTITVVSLFVFLLASTLYSQSVCEKFNVVNVSPDTSQSGGYVVSIFYNSTSKDFIGYPRVTAVKDCNGDTVGTGDMFYFGQIGATTQAYPIKLRSKGSITCYPLTLTFVSTNTMGGSDTCTLVFGTTGVEDEASGEEKSDEISPFTLHPNPATDALLIETQDYSTAQQFRIVDACGRKFFEGTITSAHTRIDTRFLAPGVYAVVFDNTTTKVFMVGMR